MGAASDVIGSSQLFHVAGGRYHFILLPAQSQCEQKLAGPKVITLSQVRQSTLQLAALKPCVKVLF